MGTRPTLGVNEGRLHAQVAGGRYEYVESGELELPDLPPCGFLCCSKQAFAEANNRSLVGEESGNQASNLARSRSHALRAIYGCGEHSGVTTWETRASAGQELTPGALEAPDYL